MNANDFLVKLRAENGVCLDFFKDAYEQFTKITKTLPDKDKGVFALNILCTLCRNIKKIPNWKNEIDNEGLISLSIASARETLSLSKSDMVKVLASIYQIHRHAVALEISPVLILELSYLPFEGNKDDFLKEYYKTYWAILADRLVYIERFKASGAEICRLLPKLTEDLAKIISFYNITTFCIEVLPVLMKKMYYLYSETNSDVLNEGFGVIFQSLLSRFDYKNVVTASDEIVYELYRKLCECFCVVFVNSIQFEHKRSLLDTVMAFLFAIFANKDDIIRCLEEFLNGFANILADDKPEFVESILKSCELTESSNDKALLITYPFLNQILRTYIENLLKYKKEEFADSLTIGLQENYLKLIIFLMKRRKTEQITKCDKCKLKNAAHDALRISFLTKIFISISIKRELDLNPLLPLIEEIVELQERSTNELKSLNCFNFETYRCKMQTDLHNTAILFYKSKYYTFSIKLFEIYLTNELKLKCLDQKGVCRGFFNKSICELESKNYEAALISAFLSVIFAGTDDPNCEKYMNYVMDVKSKAKIEGESENSCLDHDRIQSMSVLDVSRKYYESQLYGNLRHIFCSRNFSSLLKYEFSRYVIVWPSIAPVVGVWSGFNDLLNRHHCDWIAAEDNIFLLDTFIDIILETPNSVRTIHSEVFERIISELLVKFEKDSEMNLKMNIAYVTLLLLKSEFEINAASLKYGWKNNEIKNPEQMVISQTLPQEHEVLMKSVKAIDLWTKLLPQVLDENTIEPDWLSNVLKITQVFVPLMLHFDRSAHALQLAYVCCRLSQRIGDMTTYARNVGVILHHSTRDFPEVLSLWRPISDQFPRLYRSECKDNLLTCLCEAAIHFARNKDRVLAGKLIRFVQKQVLTLLDDDGHRFDMTMSRLFEAQYLLCDNMAAVSRLSAVSVMQKHCGLVKNTATTWSSRRLRNLQNKINTYRYTLEMIGMCSELLLWRRARVMAHTAIIASGAYGQAMVHALITNTHRTEDAQTKIDNHLKNILGLQTLNKNETLDERNFSKNNSELNATKIEVIETMLEVKNFNKNTTSPLSMTVSAFKIPDFFLHKKTCQCFACNNPNCALIALQIAKLEASMYFRSNENEIARNYFEGILKLFALVEAKFGHFLANLEGRCENFVSKIVEDRFEFEFQKLQVEILIEYAFFELANTNNENADDAIVRIHELLQEMRQKNIYLEHSYLNLVSAASKLKENAPKSQISNDLGVEIDFENLKLSPNANRTIEEPKTPETKVVEPLQIENKIVLNDDEIPKLKRKVIKLNLDETEKEDKNSKGTEFKMPDPKTTKPVQELKTPRKTRSKPNIFVTQSTIDESDISTPNLEFFTPKSKTDDIFSTPNVAEDIFFTPITSIKTYTKKSLRSQVVKNLEQDFHTPNARLNESEAKTAPKSRSRVSKVETGSIKSLRDKRSLKRATSPGKLPIDEKPTKIPVNKTKRSVLRPQINLSPELDVSQVNNVSRKKK